MKSFAHKLTRFGLPSVLAASVLAGCGGHSAPLATGVRATAPGAKAVAAAGLHRLVKPLTSAQTVPLLQNLSRKLATAPVDLPPRNTAAALGARAQQAELEEAAEGDTKGKQDEVDALLDLMVANGYGGDRRHMIKAIHDVTYAYVLPSIDASNPDTLAPDGWDPTEYSRLTTHFCHWLPNFNVPLASPKDYASQSLLIAQSLQDVRYYIWFSKPSQAFWNGQGSADPGCTAMPMGSQDPNNPFGNIMDFAPVYSDATGFNIVKGSGRGTWLVNITAMPGHSGKVGKIQDYLQTSTEESLQDLNHFAPIPPQLYF